jgi:hypothetical protein
LLHERGREHKARRNAGHLRDIRLAPSGDFYGSVKERALRELACRYGLKPKDAT